MQEIRIDQGPMRAPENVAICTSTTDLICFSHLRWDFVYQRPQHLLTRAAKQRRIFFWEEPSFDATGSSHLEVLQRGEQLWLIRPHLRPGDNADVEQHQLLLRLVAERRIHQPVKWYYTPMALGFSAGLAASATVYDCMDELSAFLGAPPELLEREQQLFSVADLVFTGGLRLFEAKCHRHNRVFAFPSSIDATHFARRPAVDPNDQDAIPHPRAGFYGVLDERFDYDLLATVARRMPDLQFILVGPVVKVEPRLLPQAPNVHYLGPKSYEELPDYLAGWDMAMMPFAINASTHFISPTKTPEYLAGGKPVVSTPIFDVVRGYGDRGLVTIAKDATAFEAALRAALLPASTEWKSEVQQMLRHTSWDKTWSEMWSNVEVVLQHHQRETAALSNSAVVPSGKEIALNNGRPKSYDYLVVGAGFAGSVLAERLATVAGKRVLIIDRRDHIGGNAFDEYDDAGILIHRYGPHIFHTNSAEVMEYLSQFTEWRDYEHRVLSSVDGQLVPIPINLDTINRLYNLSLDAAGMQDFLEQRAEKRALIRTSEDIVLSRVGRELYEKFFKGYTRKQWGLDPSELDSSVAGRIPIRFNHDDRYFADTYQAMPKHGYTRMFERMLDHPNIEQALGIDYREVRKIYPGITTVFTGPIDEFFNHRFGKLPYRSLHFEHRTLFQAQFQPAPVVNYPSDQPYTRITEFKYLTGQQNPRTSIVYEHPRSEGDPYYPIPRPENAALYDRYKGLAECTEGVHFVGRLATYRYYNMDQVVAQSLSTARKLIGQDPALEGKRRYAVGGKTLLTAISSRQRV